MKKFIQPFVVLLVLACAVSQAQAIKIDFSNFSPGDSIEGLGTVHPLLNISASTGNGVALFEGVEPATYGAPNNGAGIINGGISSAGGFGDINTSRSNDFTFTFDTNITISEFKLHMLDYGDLNPGGATLHTVTLEAQNGAGEIIDQSVLSYTSDSASNPTSGSAGNLFITGDAITAQPGDPGNFLFSVSGEGISYIRLLYSNNGTLLGPSDPNFAFDSLDITFVPIPSALLLFSSGLLTLIGVPKFRRSLSGNFGWLRSN